MNKLSKLEEKKLELRIKSDIKTGKIRLHRERKIEWLKEDVKNCILYLKASLDNYDSEKFILALRDVVEARGGIGQISKIASLGRENMYKSLSGTKKPYFDTILKIMKAVDISFDHLIDS